MSLSIVVIDETTRQIVTDGGRVTMTIVAPDRRAEDDDNGVDPEAWWDNQLMSCNYQEREDMPAYCFDPTTQRLELVK